MALPPSSSFHGFPEAAGMYRPLHFLLTVHSAGRRNLTLTSSPVLPGVFGFAGDADESSLPHGTFLLPSAADTDPLAGRIVLTWLQSMQLFKTAQGLRSPCKFSIPCFPVVNREQDGGQSLTLTSPWCLSGPSSRCKQEQRRAPCAVTKGM
jgi:hypothetical protein